MKNLHLLRTEKPSRIYFGVIDSRLPQLGTKEFNDLANQYFGGKPKTHSFYCDENGCQGLPITTVTSHKLI